jgi:hypothetical protein
MEMEQKKSFFIMVDSSCFAGDPILPKPCPAICK